MPGARSHGSISRLVLGAALAAALLLAVPAAFAGTAIVVTETGNHAFKVELAETPEARARGLMHRREMDEQSGMLFDFKEVRPVYFWMKNTYIPLDMIFIRADGTVARIAENAEPLSTRTVSSGAPVRYVLEVVAGTARRIGLKPGDRVLHAIIGG